MSRSTRGAGSPRPAALYRLFDADGVLLYIGSSYSPGTRYKAHSKKWWWPQVASHTEEWLPSRYAAFSAEAPAIAAEKPKFNRMSTPEYGAEQSRRQLANRVGRSVKGKVASDALRFRSRVASKVRVLGYSDDQAVGVGMLAERAYKEASGAFPDGVAYPSLEAIRAYLPEAAGD